jgi:hypothetical protein
MNSEEANCPADARPFTCGFNIDLQFRVCTNCYENLSTSL